MSHLFQLLLLRVVVVELCQLLHSGTDHARTRSEIPLSINSRTGLLLLRMLLPLPRPQLFRLLRRPPGLHGQAEVRVHRG